MAKEAKPAAATEQTGVIPSLFGSLRRLRVPACAGRATTARGQEAGGGAPVRAVAVERTAGADPRIADPDGGRPGVRRRVTETEGPGRRPMSCEIAEPVPAQRSRLPPTALRIRLSTGSPRRRWWAPCTLGSSVTS
ncbi:hypothetical protein GCM10010392_58030 [Streptomyces clavifer]|nr:hypothetical protein GCM10010392_58030 [Streptomyces clavifer]